MSTTNIIKIQGLELSRSSTSDGFTLRVLGQLDGETGFSWFRSASLEKNALQDYLVELLQLHVWNAPEDAEWIREWRKQLDAWFDGTQLQLDLYRQDVQPVTFPMIILEQKRRAR